MNTLIEKRDQLKINLIEHQKIIFQIENEIIQLNQQLAEFSDDLILENLELSEQQKLIVDATEDNILVVACPGSGKTHTLIARYVKMILDNKILPEETLLITFTKKAGMEMLNRLSKILPNKLPYHVGSLHGLGYKVLQEYNDINYTVLDEKDVKDLLRDIIDNYEHSMDEKDISTIRMKVHMIIDNASTTYPFDMKLALKKNNLEKYLKEFNYIYKGYQNKKKKENLIDFNDLMILFSKFLDDDKSNEFKNKIKYVFFDEYQDVNPVQNFILLKLAAKSKIMVVGDDAQAIYAFRGSSVKYILNFNKTFEDANKNFESSNKTSQMYLLAENYRSTPSIVDFCQDIISHNTNQIVKTVVSKQDKIGIKPYIVGFKSAKEQYKWIVDDIINKNQSGVKFSSMVILARKNNLLNELELHLIGNKIPIVKHLGLSLLDKPHIKDFLAWIIILINPKSSIHWKRIISLHPGYGIKKANIILDSNPNIMLGLKNYIDTVDSKGLIGLYDTYTHLKKIKRDIDKARYILGYLERLWIIKKEPNREGKTADIHNLLNYLKDSSLEQFINDLYLNQEVETNLDNVLYLTTIHGSKGLEWEYVYIVDVDCKNFPSIRTKYYLDELEEMDEERRLFYVGASRAKKYLYMSFTEDNSQNYSPLIRELDTTLYIANGFSIDKFNPTLIISKDITNYLKYIGYSKIYEQISSLNNNKYIVSQTLNNHIVDNKNIIGKFINYLVSKMVQINYPKKIKKFDLNLAHNMIPQKIYLEYIDPQTDWRNILEHIYYISSINCTDTSYKDTSCKDLLISQTSFNYYLELEKSICKIINGLKPKTIHTNFGVSHGSVSGSIDIFCDDTIIEIKIPSTYVDEIATMYNICQSLLYGYLLNKKDITVNRLILFNPLNGEVNNFDMTNFNFIKFKNSIYK